MATVGQLREYGANVEEAMQRCLNNEAFYLRLVNVALGDPSFGKLEAAIAAGDLEKGFEYAHALKGMLANLALTPLCKPIMEITELLRAGTKMDYTPYLEEIRTQKDKLAAIMAS